MSLKNVDAFMRSIASMWKKYISLLFSTIQTPLHRYVHFVRCCWKNNNSTAVKGTSECSIPFEMKVDMCLLSCVCAVHRMLRGKHASSVRIQAFVSMLSLWFVSCTTSCLI